MANLIVMDNFHDIYLQNILRHRDNPQFVNSPRSYKQKEILGTVFTLTNPLERVCYSAQRRVNIIFMFAEVLWYLRGSNSLDEIAYYANRLRDYSADGRTLRGCAYGPKIFNWEGTLNQWKAVVSELKKDPDSKRAVVHIRNPDEFNIENNIDATCTLTFQFFNRIAMLYMFTNMRANDMYRGVLSDVFCFTIMLELMAAELGLALGEYTHIVASSHLYDSDSERIERVVADYRGRDQYPYVFPAMPEKSNASYLDIVQKYEELLRLNKLSYAPIAGELPEYWEQVVRLFEVKRQMAYMNTIDKKTLSSLWPLYEYYIQTTFSRYL